MSGNFKKEDLRIMKTHKALTNAMFVLLNRRTFTKITVNDLCEEALVSRAAFYAHFNDKYDLLNFCLIELSKKFISYNDISVIQSSEIKLNEIINKNIKIILNLFYEPNNEILKILNDFIYSIIKLSFEEKQSNIISQNHKILASFFAGGIINMVLSQSKDKSYKDTCFMDSYFLKMIKEIIFWDEKQQLKTTKYT